MSKKPPAQGPVRGPDGRFPPGVSGNPSGRLRGLSELQAECQKLRPKALLALKRVLDSKDTSHADLLRAVDLAFKWGYGTPPVARENSEQTTDPLTVLVEMAKEGRLQPFLAAIGIGPSG